MQNITASIADADIICAETAAPPTALIVFGASGDLTSRKLLPSLALIYHRQLLDESFYLLGTGRKELSDSQFRELAAQAIKQAHDDIPTEKIQVFTQKLYYISGDYSDDKFYKNIKAKLSKLDEKHKVDRGHIFYLAVPPFLYPTIVDHLGSASLSCPPKTDSGPAPKLVVEKPFGTDLETALELDAKIHNCFHESQIYRIDHYLGKETVQNILMFRFANAIFEPLWSRNFIDHIQITIAESLGIEHRGSYYDKAGALRDMFQNHMLQMLALAAMEPPTSFDADSIRDEKTKLLRSIRPIDPAKISDSFLKAQYASGMVNGKKVPAYRDELKVDSNSKTETFVAAKLFIDNWRWKDVPFYLRTGKRLAAKDTEIAITFKNVPHSMFAGSGLTDMPPNILVLQIQPEEGISLSFQAKRPGSKICMSTLNMNFSYANVFKVDMPEAYQRLLLDCMVGDQTLFTRSDAVEVTWRLLKPILQAWQDVEPCQYQAGAQTFPEADNLIGTNGRNWRKLSTP
ncbi:glucose-6-phosphate dehydrogenase [Planctomycetota bacterium]